MPVTKLSEISETYDQFSKALNRDIKETVCLGLFITTLILAAGATVYGGFHLSNVYWVMGGGVTFIGSCITSVVIYNERRNHRKELSELSEKLSIENIYETVIAENDSHKIEKFLEKISNREFKALLIKIVNSYKKPQPAFYEFLASKPELLAAICDIRGFGSILKAAFNKMKEGQKTEFIVALYERVKSNAKYPLTENGFLNLETTFGINPVSIINNKKTVRGFDWDNYKSRVEKAFNHQYVLNAENELQQKYRQFELGTFSKTFSESRQRSYENPVNEIEKEDEQLLKEVFQ